MKRLSIILMVVLFCSLQGHAQFWTSFGWNEPHCQNCLWMEQAIRMTNRQAAEYHKIIHRYGEKIEREARKHYRYWDQSAQKIYKLRMERDRKLQRLLSPSQFRLYVRFVRETPTRIHDWRGWYNNPHYPNYRPSSSCHRYEDHYWHCQWEYTNNRWFDRFDDGKWYPGKYDRPNHQGGRPGSDNHKNKHDKDKYDKKRPDRDKDRHYDKDKKEDKRSDKDRTNSRQRTSNRRSIEKSI